MISRLGLVVSRLGFVVSRLGLMVRRLRLILGVDGFTFISDISNISVLISGVSHNLDTTVRESHSVLARGFVSVSLLRVTVVRVRVLIFDSVLKGVFGGNIVIFGFFVSRGRFVGGGRLVFWGRFVGRGRFVSRGRSGLVFRGGGRLISRGRGRLVSRSRGGFVSGGRLVFRGRCVSRGRGGFVFRGRFVSWGRLVFRGRFVGRCWLVFWWGRFVGRLWSVVTSNQGGGKKGDGEDLKQGIKYIFLKLRALGLIFAITAGSFALCHHYFLHCLTCF